MSNESYYLNNSIRFFEIFISNSFDYFQTFSKSLYIWRAFNISFSNTLNTPLFLLQNHVKYFCIWKCHDEIEKCPTEMPYWKSKSQFPFKSIFLQVLISILTKTFEDDNFSNICMLVNGRIKGKSKNAFIRMNCFGISQCYCLTTYVFYENF